MQQGLCPHMLKANVVCMAVSAGLRSPGSVRVVRFLGRRSYGAVPMAAVCLPGLPGAAGTAGAAGAAGAAGPPGWPGWPEAARRA